MGFWSWFRRKKHENPLEGTTKQDDADYVQLMKEKAGLEYMVDLTFLKEMKKNLSMRRKAELMAEKRKKRGLRYIR